MAPPTSEQPPPAESEVDERAFERLMEREHAVDDLKEKRQFRAHLLLYVVVNAVLTGIWAIASGVDSEFWPIYPMVIWGFGVLINAKDVYAPTPLAWLADFVFAPISREEISREVKRARR